MKQICSAMNKDFERVTRTVEERLGQDKAYVIDSTKARNELGWRPRISLADGLARVVSWIEAQWPRIKNETLDYVHKR